MVDFGRLESHENALRGVSVIDGYRWFLLPGYLSISSRAGGAGYRCLAKTLSSHVICQSSMASPRLPNAARGGVPLLR